MHRRFHRFSSSIRLNRHGLRRPLQSYFWHIPNRNEIFYYVGSHEPTSRAIFIHWALCDTLWTFGYYSIVLSNTPTHPPNGFNFQPFVQSIAMVMYFFPPILKSAVNTPKQSKCPSKKNIVSSRSVKTYRRVLPHITSFFVFEKYFSRNRRQSL